MMVERDENKIVGLESKAGLDAAQSEELLYWIELWHPEGQVQRVLARAAGMQLARAIFTAAQTEFPGRRITLRRGDDPMLDSAG